MSRHVIRRLYAISQARNRPLWRTIRFVIGPPDKGSPDEQRRKARARVRPAT